MTAQDLIGGIFARSQQGPQDVRRISADQLRYLRDLILKDPEAAKVHNGQGGSLVWTPAGKHRYVLTEDPGGGKRHTLMRFARMEAEGQGSLF